MNLLTAEQIAKELGLSVKTFYKRVRKYSIPFVDARQPMFNRDEVYRCLTTTMNERAEVEKPIGRRRGKGIVLPNKKYRDLLGLD